MSEAASTVTAIEGTITTADGVERAFRISDVGYQQWGATTEQLGATVDVLDRITTDLREDGHLVDADEEDDDR